MPLRITKWDVAAILERHLDRLYNIQRYLAKTGGPTDEIERSLQEIKSLVESLSSETEEEE